MNTGVPCPAFEHDPLPEHISHFRLLRIIRGDFEQHVECEILAWPIDNAPSYYAISYTWGDPADTSEITVNGRPLIVRRNCEYVLQQAFASKTSEYFWIDAICIAQTTEEKNHQVGIMGQIYSGAKHVLACVGRHEDDSQFLSEAIKEQRSLLTKIHGLPSRSWQHNFGYNPIEESNRVLFRCLLSMKSKMRQRLYRSFFSFLRRPYFKRLWIIQELHLAQHVSFCFGPAIEAAEDFLALHKLLSIWCQSIIYGSPYRLVVPLARLVRYTVAYSRTTVSVAMESSLTALRTCSFLLYFACTTEKQEVLTILLDPDLQCADPRDRLFGLLSVVDRLFENVLKPDYTKDRFQVALEALKFIRRRSRRDPHWLARELCSLFQVTGDEASLRNALALRSSASRPKAMPEHTGHYQTLRSKYEWGGVQISWNVFGQDLSVSLAGSYFGVDKLARKYEGCRILHVGGGVAKTVSILVPGDTTFGDWWIFLRPTVREGLPMGLIIRKLEDGKHNVIGQTYPVGSDNTTLEAALNRCGSFKSFECHWYPEDILLWGWIYNEFESHGITQDRIREYVNRRICAWDGSSYFLKWADQLVMYPQEDPPFSSLPLSV